MNTRIDKLNAEFKRYIAEILSHKVKDPRITEMFTVLDVVCDRELDTAKVYISVYSTNSIRAKSTFDAICENAPFVRREISRCMHIRKVPEFRFVADTTMQYGEKIDRILNEIKAENNN